MIQMLVEVDVTEYLEMRLIPNTGISSYNFEKNASKNRWLFFIISYCILFDFSDEPEVETQQTFIHTAETDETEVICTVHASPKAQVVWYKNGVELSEKQALFKKFHF